MEINGCTFQFERDGVMRKLAVFLTALPGQGVGVLFRTPEQLGQAAHYFAAEESRWRAEQAQQDEIT